jgi:hypothetical protein
VFLGVDPRQPVAVQVLAHSIYRRASKPVSITPLVLSQLPIKRVGLTEFTFTRYLPPYLCHYEGHSIFMDADMLCLGDVHELVELADDRACAVSVVKNKLRFEWPSLMVFNNARCTDLTPQYIETAEPQTLKWADEIGSLPSEWNILVGYDEPIANPKLVHFTQGIPCFNETKDCPYSAEWVAEARASMSTVTWPEIMGNSVHAQPVLARLKASQGAVNG